MDNDKEEIRCAAVHSKDFDRSSFEVDAIVVYWLSSFPPFQNEHYLASFINTEIPLFGMTA